MKLPVAERTEADAHAFVSFVLGAVLAGIGSLLVAIFTVVGGPYWDDLLLDARGVSVDAVVIDTSRAGAGSRRVRQATVEYRIGDRPAIRTGVRLRGFVAVGANVPLEVDPDDPSRYRRRGRSASLFGGFVLIPALAALLGFVLLARSLSMRRKRRLS